MKLCYRFILLLFATTALAHGETNERYLIAAEAAPELRQRCAYDLIQQQLKIQPELEQRLLDPTHKISGKPWSYGTQTYCNRAVLLHLIAIQIKAMAEYGAIKDPQQIFDSEYGIGSKNHKDKGTINNPLSFWGHPVQSEILGQRSKFKALKVYHAFRLTIKNELIHFARQQPLEWHQSLPQQKLADILAFLKQHHTAASQELRQRLADYQLTLETLLQRALETNLLS